MSTNWGFVCRSYDPEIVSDCWFNHGDDALMDLVSKIRAEEWPRAADLVPSLRLAYGDQLAPMVMIRGDEVTAAYALPVAPRAGGGTSPWHGPPDWVQEHLDCDIALRSEYGDIRELEPRSAELREDAVNHPPHYGGDTTYETIKVIDAWELGFALGNAVKYISRAGKKGDHLEDLRKARWYLDHEIARLEQP